MHSLSLMVRPSLMFHFSVLSLQVHRYSHFVRTFMKDVLPVGTGFLIQHEAPRPGKQPGLGTGLVAR